MNIYILHCVHRVTGDSKTIVIKAENDVNALKICNDRWFDTGNMNISIFIADGGNCLK